MKKGFTLIELLIVVAIIAILAAIAVPNFLEAQTRAKVSRVKADMRSAATAIEAYYVDNNKYPYAAPYDIGTPTPSNQLKHMTLLESPVAYLTSADLIDPFVQVGTTKTSVRYFCFQQYYAGSGSYDLSSLPKVNVTTGELENYTGRGITQTGEGLTWGDAALVPGTGFAGWLLSSNGPDRDESDYGAGEPACEWAYSTTQTNPEDTMNSRIYNPTNGTVSIGNVIRVGGMASPVGMTPIVQAAQ